MKNKSLLVSVLVILSILLTSVISCTDGADDNGSQTLLSTEQLLANIEGVDASLVYASKCAVCHGNDRQGGVGPSLTQDQSVAFLSSWIPVHRTGVNLDPRLTDVLIEYLYINSSPSTIPAPTDPSVVYAYNCSVCHGAFRQGGNGGPTIHPAYLTNYDAEFLSVFLSDHFSGVDLTSDRLESLAEWLKNTDPR
jgi:mono/diheme cytochrome c family protein